MANYWGPLRYRAGDDVSTVVDPRFGEGADPTQPAGWAGTGGGGGSSEGLLLAGPYSDWGVAVNSALAANSVVQIASGLGDLPLKTEIVIPSNRTLEMGRGTRFSITADHSMPTLLATARKAGYAWIRPDGNATTWAENIIIRGVRIDGSQMPTVQPNPDGTYWGICIIYARDVLVEDSICTKVQGQTDPTWETSCYGIGATEAERVDFVRCKGWDNGYQNLTVYDGAQYINFVNCYSGSGWRTGFQIHRNSSDINVVNLTVKQNHASPSANSSVTLHGQADSSAIKRVTFIGLNIESTPTHPKEGRGGFQMVGTTDDLTIIGARIRTANYGMYLRGHNIRVIGCDVETPNTAFLMADNDVNVNQGSSAGQVSVADSRFVTTGSALPAVRIAPTFGQIDDVRFSDCDIVAGGGAGIALEAAAIGAHLSGNRIRTTGPGMALIGSGMAYGNDLTGTTGITGTTTGFTLANNVGD